MLQLGTGQAHHQHEQMLPPGGGGGGPYSSHVANSCGIGHCVRDEAEDQAGGQLPRPADGSGGRGWSSAGGT